MLKSLIPYVFLFNLRSFNLIFPLTNWPIIWFNKGQIKNNNKKDKRSTLRFIVNSS